MSTHMFIATDVRRKELDGNSLSIEHSPFLTVDASGRDNRKIKPMTHVNSKRNGSRFFTRLLSYLRGYFIAIHRSNDIIVRLYVELSINAHNK